ncbi:gamma-glutamyl-gamma-aminobutyrate hydrolase family protein [Hypericibacter sp.]|uniref:gamma-glutamyl-gamma-aminobutyrate hydrolase family protein n=1 Tax=Hypericibacter sp. TaxID=2705401 RepID=UPI003D6CEF15
MYRIDASWPAIGIPACVKSVEELPFHAVGEKYITAVVEGAQGMPLLLPVLGEAYDLPSLLDRLDGLLFTGSLSNIHPRHYGGPPDRADSPQDPQRDATTLPLIRAAVAAGVPLFCICRGHQELNVALGGTLHTQVHTLPGKLDHRSPKNVDYDARYAPQHRIALEPTGMLTKILGRTEIEVNSLHWQAIDRLAPGLVVEAKAPDDVIEAVRVEKAKNFAFGVQWHPEYKVTENAVSLALFRAFGTACRERARARLRAPGKAAE